jgi:hypothetical protein
MLAVFLVVGIGQAAREMPAAPAGKDLSGVAQAKPISGSSDAQCAKLAIQTLGKGFKPSNYTFIGGTTGDDKFAGKGTAEGKDVFCGFGGNDTKGALGTESTLDTGDLFIGGAGDDAVAYNYGTFYGSDGNNFVTINYATFNGGDGNNGVFVNYATFNGGAGVDFVNNNQEGGTFNGGAGDDGTSDNNGTFNGGDGTDLVFNNYGTFNGGAGNDTVTNPHDGSTFEQ